MAGTNVAGLVIPFAGGLLPVAVVFVAKADPDLDVYDPRDVHSWASLIEFNGLPPASDLGSWRMDPNGRDRMAVSTSNNFLGSIQKRSRYLSAIPAVAALFYPAALFALYRSFGLLHDATDSGEWLLDVVAVGVSLILTYGIPALSFVIAYQLGAVQLVSSIARKIAHLAVASPPLFTLIGVIFYIAGLSNADYVLWGIVWIGASTLIFTQASRAEPAEQTPDRAHSTALRVTHGMSALIILIVFLLPHIADHLTAIWSVGLHKTVMQELRRIYRTDIIQPLLVTLFIFQISSGLVLWRARMRIEADLFGTLQTAAGIYLAIYIVSHMMAVFVLGRVVMKVDNDFLFASGAPTGLLHDRWNVRLIPHYSLAVCALFIHLACGLRGVLLSHGTSIATANGFAWPIIGFGGAIAATIILAMCGLHATSQ